jgi:hypothetical protein
VLRKPLFIRAVAATAITLGTLSIGAAASASAAPSGIPNYLVSAIAINKAAHTATLPLYRGEAPGIGRVWFILTESSNLADAERLGINWAPKLANALGTPAVQQATLAGGGGNRQFGRDSFVRFSGGVNFSGKRLLIPGPDPFPLDPATHAGPVGQKDYSPAFTFGDGVVFNGAEIANRTGIHPKVVSLNLRRRRAVMHLTAGFYLGRHVLYLSTESSSTQIAARGLLVSAAPGGPVNHDPEINGLRAAGIVVNCPPIFVAAGA